LVRHCSWHVVKISKTVMSSQQKRIPTSVQIAHEGGLLKKNSYKNRHSRISKKNVLVLRTNANADMSLQALTTAAHRDKVRQLNLQKSARKTTLRVYKADIVDERMLHVPNVFARRDENLVRTILGDFSTAKIDKAAYKKRAAKNKGLLCLRVNARWFSVVELISVGFLRQCWSRYSGMIDENMGCIGRYELMREFHLPILDPIRRSHAVSCMRLNLPQQQEAL